MKLEGFPKARDLRRISPGIVAVMLMMAGCATQNVQQIDWQHGAQRAWITRIYTPAELAGSDVDSCLANLPESERRAGQFAQVSYWQGRWRALKPARIPDGGAIRPGDEVELYPAVCNSSQVPVINRILRRTVDPD